MMNWKENIDLSKSKSFLLEVSPHSHPCQNVHNKGHWRKKKNKDELLRDLTQLLQDPESLL